MQVLELELELKTLSEPNTSTRRQGDDVTLPPPINSGMWALFYLLMFSYDFCRSLC